MEKVQKTLELPKAASDLGDGLVAFASVAKQALADGWQPGQDLPVLVSAAVANLIKPLGELKDLGLEAHEDVLSVAQALSFSGLEIAKLLKKQAPQA